MHNRIDDCLTMPRLTIHHKTVYRYERPVAFGEHRIMRHEHGAQHPLDTLQAGSGTCRDYALFMIEALRRSPGMKR